MAAGKGLARNTAANIAQAVASAALLFGLYRYINETLGVDQLGVWSVVLATVSASRLADLGLSAGVTRFVARDIARDNPSRAGDVVDTATLTLMVSVGIVLPLIFPVLGKVMPLVLQGGDLVVALDILPYALVSLWLTVVAAVFQGGLDGCQRMDLRAGLVIAGHAVLLGLAFLLVPEHGLVGLAWAQVGQGVVLLVGGRLLLQVTVPIGGWVPRKWGWPVLREMLGYGVNIQAATVFMLMLDPITKALLARFGGPSATGYFEMANQVVLKARSVIVTANRAIVPHVAELAERAPERLGELYRQNLRVLTFVTIPSFALMVAWSGGISWLLIGEHRPEFDALLGLLAGVWILNILASPAYFTNMGTGRVGWNTVSHGTMGVLNGGLAWVLGIHFGGAGVAVAYAVAVAVGSAVLIGAFHRLHSVSLRGGFGREQLGIALSGVAAIAISWIVPLRPAAGDPITVIASLVGPFLVLSVAVWLHPLRRPLMDRLPVWGGFM